MDLAQSASQLDVERHFLPLPVRRSNAVYGFLKRFLDIAIVVAVAPIALLVVGILAFLVKRDGHAALYTQERIGKGGRIFTLLKLRTMVPDADKVLAAYLAANPLAAREWHETQKLRCDPRITPVGAFIRRHSLDELPQLWNVLVGDMSLVGPRPMMPEQQSLYPGEAYFAMRPGLTGLWQVSARNDSAFASRAAYDTRYWQIMSLRADLTIMAMTVGVVLRGTGL